MRKQVDVEFFLLVVAREMSYCDGMRNALNGYYREQKTRFYEIAKKSKYYNHFIMAEGSLEHEINIKRIFGILLCADNDCELRNLVIKLIVSYKSDMKFLSNQKLDIAKYALYMKKQQNTCIDDGHNVPGRDVDFWLQTYILYYNHAEHMSEDLQQSFYKYILSETKDTKDEVYKTEKSKINDVNWKKQLNIPEYVSLGINELDSEEVLYTLGDILGIGTYEDLNDKASNLFDIFMDRDITNAKREIKFRDIVRTSAFCLLLDNMLKAEGLNFFSIYTEKVISKKDKEYLLKAIAKSLSGTYASALNTDEISIKKNKDGEMIFSPEYDLAYSDIVLAFLFKGLIRAIKDNKKYAKRYTLHLFRVVFYTK